MQTLKECSRCLESKEVGAFPVIKQARGTKSKGRIYRGNICRKCWSIWRQTRVRKNKEETYRKRRALHAKTRKWVQEQKEKNPCTDCGRLYPYYVMEYDHVGKKKFGIAMLSSSYTNKCRIAHEMKKCDLVCRNCHAVRTHERKDNQGRPFVFRPEPVFEHIAGCLCQRYTDEKNGFPKRPGSVFFSVAYGEPGYVQGDGSHASK